MYKYLRWDDETAFDNERLRREWRKTDRQIINVLSQNVTERIKQEFRRQRGTLTILQFLWVMDKYLGSVATDRIAFLARILDMSREIDVNSDAEIDWDEWSSYLVQMSQSHAQGASFFASKFSYEKLPCDDPSAIGRVSPIQCVQLMQPGDEDSDRRKPLIAAIEEQSQMLRLFTIVGQHNKLLCTQIRSSRHDTAFQPHEVLAMETISSLGVIITSSQESRTGPYYLNSINAKTGELVKRISVKTAQDVLCWHPVVGLVFACGIDGRDIRGFNPISFEIRKRLPQDCGAVRSMSSYPSALSAFLMAGSDDGCIRVYDLHRSCILQERTIHAHYQGVQKVKVSSQLDTLLSYGISHSGHKLSPLRANVLYLWPVGKWLGDLEAQRMDNASSSSKGQTTSFKATSQIKPKALIGHRYAVVGADMQGATNSFPHVLSVDCAGYLRVWNFHSCSCLQVIPVLEVGRPCSQPTLDSNDDRRRNSSRPRPATASSSRPLQTPDWRPGSPAKTIRPASQGVSVSWRPSTSMASASTGSILPPVKETRLSYGRATLKLRPSTSAGEAELLHVHNKPTMHRQFAIDALGLRESESIVDSRVYPYSNMSKVSPREGLSKVDTFLKDPGSRSMSVSHYSRIVSHLHEDDGDSDFGQNDLKADEEIGEEEQTRPLTCVNDVSCLPAELGGRQRKKTALIAGNKMQLLAFTVHAPDIGAVLGIHYMIPCLTFFTVHANAIVVWDALHGRPKRVFTSNSIIGGGEFISAVPDSRQRRLVVTDNDNKLNLINYSTGVVIKRSRIFEDSSIQSTQHVGHLNETAVTSVASEVIVLQETREGQTDDQFAFARAFGLPDSDSILRYITKVNSMDQSHRIRNEKSRTDQSLARLKKWILAKGKKYNTDRRRLSLKEDEVHKLFSGSASYPVTTTTALSSQLNLFAMAVRMPSPVSSTAIMIWKYGTGAPQGICFLPSSLGKMDEIVSLSFLEPYPLLLSIDTSGKICLWAVPPSIAAFTLRGIWDFPTQGSPTATTVAEQDFDPERFVLKFRVPPMQHGTVGGPQMEYDPLFHQGMVIWIGDDRGVINRFLLSKGALCVALLPDLETSEELLNFDNLSHLLETSMQRCFEKSQMNFRGCHLSHKNSWKSVGVSRIPPSRLVAVTSLSISQEQLYNDYPLVAEAFPSCKETPFGALWEGAWKGHQQSITRLHVIVDNGTLASSSYDGLSRIWDSEGRLLGALTANPPDAPALPRWVSSTNDFDSISDVLLAAGHSAGQIEAVEKAEARLNGLSWAGGLQREEGPNNIAMDEENLIDTHKCMGVGTGSGASDDYTSMRHVAIYRLYSTFTLKAFLQSVTKFKGYFRTAANEQTNSTKVFLTEDEEIVDTYDQKATSDTSAGHSKNRSLWVEKSSAYLTAPEHSGFFSNFATLKELFENEPESPPDVSASSLQGLFQEEAKRKGFSEEIATILPVLSPGPDVQFSDVSPLPGPVLWHWRPNLLKTSRERRNEAIELFGSLRILPNSQVSSIGASWRENAHLNSDSTEVSEQSDDEMPVKKADRLSKTIRLLNERLRSRESSQTKANQEGKRKGKYGKSKQEKASVALCQYFNSEKGASKETDKFSIFDYVEPLHVPPTEGKYHTRVPDFGSKTLNEVLSTVLKSSKKDSMGSGRIPDAVVQYSNLLQEANRSRSGIRDRISTIDQSRPSSRPGRPRTSSQISRSSGSRTNQPRPTTASSSSISRNRSHRR